MPDTPRTRDELLNDIFPDGQAARSITAQDMRDFVVSGVSDTADELFMLRDVAGDTQLSDIYGLTYPAASFATIAALSDGMSVLPDLSGSWPDQGSARELRDPSGWVLDSTFDSDWWAGTFPVHTLLVLQPGRYAWLQRVTYEKAAGGPLADPSANFLDVRFDTADDPSTRTGALGGDAFWYGVTGSQIPQPAFATETFPAVAAVNKYTATTRGGFTVAADDGDARVFPSLSAGLEADVHILTWQIQLQRIA